MATHDERRLLLPRNAGDTAEPVDEDEQRRVVELINEAVEARLVCAFKDARLAVPSCLRGKKRKAGASAEKAKMPVGGIESRLAELKKGKGVEPCADATQFAAFRIGRAASSTAEAVAN